MFKTQAWHWLGGAWGWGVSRPQPLRCLVSCRNLIEPEQCTYNFTVSRINICLKKRQSQRWGGLEAPATRGLYPGCPLAPPAHGATSAGQGWCSAGSSWALGCSCWGWAGAAVAHVALVGDAELEAGCWAAGGA